MEQNKNNFSMLTDFELQQKIESLENELAKATLIDAAKLEMLVQLKAEVDKRK